MKRLVVVTCLVLLFILSGATLCLLLRRPDPPPTAPVIVMPLPYKIPREKVSLFDRCIPRRPSWNWLWRLRDTLAGKRKVCDFGATVVDFAGSAESFLAEHPLPAPAFTATNGLRIWLLSQPEMSTLSHSLRQEPGPEILSVPRIITADGMQASLFSGGTLPIAGTLTPVGMMIDLVPHARPEAMDLTTIVSLTEVVTNQANPTDGSAKAGATGVQTNFEVAARLQIPKGSGVFMLQGPPGAANPKHIGVLLSVSVLKPK